jgi:hypothetical protein
LVLRRLLKEFFRIFIIGYGVLKVRSAEAGL